MSFPARSHAGRSPRRAPRTLRRRAVGVVALLAASALALAGCGTVTTGAEKSAETITVTDDQGRKVEITGPVKRAVVINSYGNEIIRAIGAGDTIVGTDRTSSDRLPYLGIGGDQIIAEGLDQLNYEAIAELNPDVVILPRNAVWQEAAQQLKGFNIPVVVATAWDYAAFEDTVNLLGKIFGAEKGAQKLLAFNKEINDLLAERLKGVDPVPVYFETVDPYLTVLPASGFHAMIEAAGGRNVFADATGGSSSDELTVDPAQVVSRNPALIFKEFEPSFTPVDRFQEVADEMLARPGFGGIQAVQNGQVYVTNGWATSASAKAIGALYLATWLNPDLFADVDPEVYLKRWVTEFQGAEFTSADDYIQGPFKR
ncbi:ABC transporter substrate-binding protein [Leucobacter sp. wl10]|uniref:ABC transporter substrate-binding protein n=1 Tax=Leucobacter sp. wl10 TaxID=2304677 RepID=UPI000E5BB93E|nr:ABC transporter substrate-binding protein [Leucobacter sp. wl10]RGE23124.1 ABC transporter substrate-binding protein [Leucobacter sp. wl10]